MVFDLAAVRLSMIASDKKSVNHPRTVASMHETGWEQQQQQRHVRLRSDSTVWSEFAFGPIGHCFLCYNQFYCVVMWSLRFPFFWSCVCHYMWFTTLRMRPLSMFLDAHLLTMCFCLDTLGARDFSSAVSGFCQVFTADNVSAFGQHRKFPPHVRKTSGTQGTV